MDEADKVIVVLNQGLQDIHKRLDEIQKTCSTRQVSCAERMAEIEKEAAINKAVCEAHEYNADKSTDIWKRVLQGMATAVGGVLAVWILLMIASHLGLLLKAAGK